MRKVAIGLAIMIIADAMTKNGYIIDYKTAEEIPGLDVSEEPIPTDERRRRGKGERKRNKAERWSR